MSSTQEPDDLTVEQTAGYKGPGERKTEAELAQLDYRMSSFDQRVLLSLVRSRRELHLTRRTGDDSLKAWEKSLGVAGSSGSSVPQVKVSNIVISSPNRPDIVLDFRNTTCLTDAPITLKEDTEFTVSINFSVENALVSGLQYVQIAKRKGIRVDKSQAMIGSFSPGDQKKKFASETTPSGLRLSTIKSDTCT